MLNLLGQGYPSAAPGIQSAHVLICHNHPPYSPYFVPNAFVALTAARFLRYRPMQLVALGLTSSLNRSGVQNSYSQKLMRAGDDER
jgi:hypothetical protein